MEEKLSKAQKMLVDTLMENLDKGCVWKQGWKGGYMMSPNGKPYRGDNELLLSLVSMARGYEDCRWMTFNAMKKAGLSFKRDEEGKCLGTNAGVPVEYFETYDKMTHKAFTRATLEDMDTDEAKKYLRDNVYTVRKYYMVFNCSLIKDMPEYIVKHTENINDRIDEFIGNWSESECEIVYGGGEACYVPMKDEIHLPVRKNFVSDDDFYGVALHEIAHSTGAKERLNRDLSGHFGSKTYAQEELIAEIASLFIGQEFGVAITESHIENSAAYIDSWKVAIKENPNALFKAVTEASKICKYMTDAEERMSAKSGLIAA
ncbi:MAG: ssDNA-binding domain-containing protein [Clostridia bacterium]|nr:ssDNA-binding domain-containing protein [Clostridia bacterium]